MQNQRAKATVIPRLDRGIHQLGLLVALLLLSWAVTVTAQQGHPLTGSWSGDRSVDDGTSRVLLVLDLQPDQRITGYILERGARIPLSGVSLDPENWTVSFRGEGTDRAGNEVGYAVEGKIENLGSINERAIVGTWRDGELSGEFRVVIN